VEHECAISSSGIRGGTGKRKSSRARTSTAILERGGKRGRRGDEENCNQLQKKSGGPRKAAIIRLGGERRGMQKTLPGAAKKEKSKRRKEKRSWRKLRRIAAGKKRTQRKPCRISPHLASRVSYASERSKISTRGRREGGQVR